MPAARTSGSGFWKYPESSSRVSSFFSPSISSVNVKALVIISYRFTIASMPFTSLELMIFSSASVSVYGLKRRTVSRK